MPIPILIPFVGGVVVGAVIMAGKIIIDEVIDMLFAKDAFEADLDNLGNASGALQSYHDKYVKLSKEKQNTLRDKRKKVITSITNALKDYSPEAWNQGSYIMGTIIQRDDEDYDIDVGISFPHHKLIDKDGLELSPSQLKKLVEAAIDHRGFKKEPEIKDNCIRIFYSDESDAFHVDVPCYRQFKYKDIDGEDSYHLADASSSWTTESNPKAVNEWFRDGISSFSPKGEMRRVIRLIKRLTDLNSNDYPKGFPITVLVYEVYKNHQSEFGRIDLALYECIRQIKQRIEDDKDIEHPIVNEYLIEANMHYLVQNLNELFSEILDDCQVLDDCSNVKAASIWGEVFNEPEYFEEIQRSCIEETIYAQEPTEPNKPTIKNGSNRNA